MILCAENSDQRKEKKRAMRVATKSQQIGLQSLACSRANDIRGNAFSKNKIRNLFLFYGRNMGTCSTESGVTDPHNALWSDYRQTKKMKRVKNQEFC